MNGRFRHLTTPFLIFLAIYIPSMLLITGCQAALLEPPRLATITAQSQITPTATAVPVHLAAPTATPSPKQPSGSERAVENSVLTVWINDNSPDHTAALGNMMAGFQESTGFDVAWQMVDPALLPDLVNTAVLSGTLPDIILHPVDFTAGWTERGILNPAAADAAIEQIGRNTFDAAALELVDINGQSAALPSDGYKQLWLYRSDWFAEEGLDQPDNYADMLAGAEALFSREEGAFISGLVVPTESNLVNTHRVFEQIALANGCNLIDAQGEIRLLEPNCQEALDFYFQIINQFSPPGVQTDVSARNAFLDGRTGIIMSSPTILSELAEAGLAQNTGVVTAVTGSSPQAAPADFSNLTVMGITSSANAEAAASFANYWFNAGYPQWLGTGSEKKVPLRPGTVNDPDQFIVAWGTTPLTNGQSLQELYGEDVVAQLRDGVAAAPRWGLREDQGTLVTELYENLTLSVVLQEMLSGYFSPAKTIFEAYNRLLELLPDYQFPITPSPTPPDN